MQYWLLIFFLMLSIGLKANKLDKAVAQQAEVSLDSVFNAFPVETVSLKDIQQLEIHRIDFFSQGLDGDAFLMSLVENKVATTTFDFEQLDGLKELLTIGEVLSHSNSYLPDSVYIYMAASDFIFGSIADTVETLIAHKELDIDEFNVRYIVQRLMDNQYGIDIPTSNWLKLYNYCKKGRWDYIWHKFTSTYQKEFITALLLGLLGMMGVWWIWKKRFKIFKPKLT